MLRRFCAPCLLLLGLAAVAADWQPISLKGKSDAELLALLSSGKDAIQREVEARSATHLPEGFWELPAKEAAIALLRANHSPKNRAATRINFRSSEKALPPASGEVGFEWEFRGDVFHPAAGVTVLRASPAGGELTFSRVQIVGPVAEEELRAATQKTRAVPVPAALARQIYDTIWWLGRIPMNEEGVDIVSTADGSAKFWIAPPPGRPEQTGLFPSEIAERWTDEYNSSLRANFAWFILQRLMEEKLGLASDDADAPKVGKREVRPERELVHESTPPDPADEKQTRTWISALLGVIADPRAQDFHSYAIERLVPHSEPLRYHDARIDETLLQIAHAGTANVPREQGPDTHFRDANYAAHALAERGHPESGPLLLQLLEKPQPSAWACGPEVPLEGASLVALHDPEVRTRLLAYLRAQLEKIGTSSISVDALFGAIWTGHFTELTPALQKLATASPMEIASKRNSGSSSDGVFASGRFHQARHILSAWQEKDPLTKLKLSAIVEASTYRELEIPNPLRACFDALTPNEQTEFLRFLDWLALQPSNTTRGEHAAKLRAQLK